MHPAVYSKIELDPAVEAAIKASVIVSCGACDKEFGPNDDSSVEKQFNDFSNRNLDLGAKQSVSSSDHLGHVKVFKDWVVRLHKMTGDSLSLVERNLRILCGISAGYTSQQRKLAENWARRRLFGGGDPAREISLTGPVCFVFLPDPTRTVSDMFTRGPESLPCRLGLPSFWDSAWGSSPPAGTLQEYIGYVFPVVKLKNIRSVTVFHPGYRSVRDLWKPGGKTEPHPYGPKDHIALGGLDELVCGQVHASVAANEVFGFAIRY